MNVQEKPEVFAARFGAKEASARMVAFGLEVIQFRVPNHLARRTHVFGYVTQLWRRHDSAMVILVHDAECLLLLPSLLNLGFS
jgi:hypothetical protein